MYLCSLESVQSLSQPCHLSSCHNQVCFFQILTILLRLPHKNLSHQAKRNIQFCLLRITCRADSTSPARVEHDPNTSPSISQSFPLTSTGPETGTWRHQNANLDPTQSAAITTFESSPWESCLTWHSSIPWEMRAFYRITPIADLRELHWSRPGHCRHLSQLCLETPYGTHSSYRTNRFIF